MDFTPVKRGKSKEMPSKIIIYGVPKIGKSRLASQWPAPFFIDIEGGLGYLDNEVDATPRLRSFDDVMAWFKHLYESETLAAKTIVIDSLDWLEKLAQERLIKREGATSITDPSCKAFAYHKGVEEAASDAIKALKWLDAIHEKHGTVAVLIAHSEVKTVDLPNQEPYSRHQLKLSKALAGKSNEWADLILFADYSFHVSKEGKTSEPKPVLFAGGSASFVGGGRMMLSKELPLNYNAIEKEITK
jgi:hypothetical protein